MAKTRKIPLRKSVVSGEVIDKRDLRKQSIHHKMIQELPLKSYG